jgi:uncharacterized protein YjbI with pentapeptide repeats
MAESAKEKYREVSPDELRRILAEHKKWVETDGKEGERANLSKADLSWANEENAVLTHANLQGAYLFKANLQGASLIEADLQGAFLDEANLQDAYLTVANLQDASLNVANLQDAYLNEANLQGASLNIANFQGAFLFKANLQGAFLFKANLQGARLRAAVLQGASLIEANLQGANLDEANLQGALLYLAILEKAELRGTKLKGADLGNADLTGAKSLLAEQLGGCDLTGATLPPDIHNFAGPLKVVEDASKHARYTFFTMLLTCAYTALAIATHSPSDTREVTLPVINIGVPVLWFYRTTPMLILALYQYFLFYMQRLWEKVADLPSVFPDGYPLDKKVYPWLLTEIIHAHVPKLREKDPPRMFKRQRAFSVFLAWLAVPATLLFIICKYWTADDSLWLAIQIGVAIIAAVIGIESYLDTVRTLRGDKAGAYGEAYGDL